MDKTQQKQEEQYQFPYHHIPNIGKRGFSQVRILDWGFMYMAYLEAVLEQVGEKPFNSLLDIGCGDGKFLHEARRRFPTAKLWGNDYSEHAISFARAFNFNNGVELTTAPIEKVVAEHGVFDVVTAIEVLEHIPLNETGEFAKTFAQALTPKGVGIITVPSDNRPVSRKHYQHFNADSLRSTLEPHLRVTDIFYLNENSKKSRLLQRLLSNRFFALNYAPALNFLYRYYCKNLLRATPEGCNRLMAVVVRS